MWPKASKELLTWRQLPIPDKMIMKWKNDIQHITNLLLEISILNTKIYNKVNTFVKVH